MARRKKRGERHRWKPRARRAGTHAFVYPTSEEQEAALPPPGFFAKKYKRGDKVRFHPAAKAMLAASPIPIDANAVMTVVRIVPAEENVHADSEAAMLKLPSGMTTMAETDLLLPVGKNPRKHVHRASGEKLLKRAKENLKLTKDWKTDPKQRLELLFTVLKDAAVAREEAHYAGKPYLEVEAWGIGDEAMKSLRAMFQSKNPADIPGGSMSACIAIMEARPDVENAGALCNWLAQRAGERESGFRLPSTKRKKMKPEARSIMRKLMKGT